METTQELFSGHDKASIPSANTDRAIEFLHAVVEHIDEPIVACNTAGDLRFINRSARLIRNQSTHKGSRDAESIAPEYEEGRQRDHESSVDYDELGHDLSLWANARTLLNPSGEVIGAMASLRQVSDENLVRETYRDLTAERDSLLLRLGLQIERMPLAYMLLDSDLRVIEWNPMAEQVFGYTRDDVLGEVPPFENLFVHEWTQPEVSNGHKDSRGDSFVAHSNYEVSTKAGKTITCEWFNTRLFEKNGRFSGMFCLAQDVTERKSIEEQLRQSQKLEAIGQLAGGIAHDFNNLLTIIIGCAEMILSSDSLIDDSRSILEEIKNAGERAASLTRQLLAFSRKEVVAPIVLDVNKVVLGTEKMLRRVIGENIKLSVRLQDDLRNVRIDPGQLEQILLNLAVNARDAMPQGGQLTIATSNVQIDGDYQYANPGFRSGEYIQLIVEDSGDGMSEEIRRHIFEPFFTTKGPAKGTGLGLAVVHGIVEQSGGHIVVESEQGLGTAFKIFLPRTDVDEGSVPVNKVSAACPSGTETILLVEDERGVRHLNKRVLADCGYTVLEASCGEEALEVFESHVDPIQLLVTDVVMPGIDGGTLAKRLASIDTNLKVLYVSGYTDDAVIQLGELNKQFLAKPFSPITLAQKVRDVLDSVRW